MNAFAAGHLLCQSQASFADRGENPGDGPHKKL
jgi:hypothetical protein